MAGRVQDKVAIVVGGGQTPGETIGNGRAAARDRRVPLGHKMGTAWDVAHAALFLHSDEARFITGALLPVEAAARPASAATSSDQFDGLDNRR